MPAVGRGIPLGHESLEKSLLYINRKVKSETATNEKRKVEYFIMCSLRKVIA